MMEALVDKFWVGDARLFVPEISVGEFEIEHDPWLIICSTLGDQPMRFEQGNIEVFICNAGDRDALSGPQYDEPKIDTGIVAISENPPLTDAHQCVYYAEGGHIEWDAEAIKLNGEDIFLL